jgi:hypothetical protein
MAQYHRLRTGDTMMIKFRPAMAMIELIFAIVIIAISVITIPTMMSVANNAAKGIVIDEDAMARLSGWTLDKFQARWDRNYLASGSGALNIATIADLNCSRVGGYRIGSDENISSMQCNTVQAPSAIPNPSLDGNLSLGIEQLNGGAETISVTTSGGTTVDINATYSVRYVDSTVATNGNIQTALWRIGSSSSMAPDGWTAAVDATHLKRVVTRFQNTALGVDTTLTFFKSNKGN